MATVKIKFRASSVAAKEGMLVYQVIHDRVVRQIRSGYRIYPEEWDEVRAAVRAVVGTDESRADYLRRLGERLAGNVRRLEIIIARLEREGTAYTADEVIQHYEAFQKGAGCVVSFGRFLIGQLRRIGRDVTAETYETSLNSFVRFLGDRGDILFDELDAHLAVEYETYLKSRGMCPNTCSYYMRNLRAMYNRAVENGTAVQRNPFRHVYTGIDKTVKRAVSLGIIRRIRDLDLSLEPVMDYTRDIFMFSFYTRGMSFVDMAFLKKKDLQNGILSYRRHKTNQQLFIKWEAPMQEILDKYDTAGTSYLLPIIKAEGTDERRQYKNAVHLVNTKLKRIGERLGLSVPLTTYVARHAWASIARSKNVSVAVISEAMGHDSESTTRIYLATLDTSSVDKANRLVLDSL